MPAQGEASPSWVLAAFALLLTLASVPIFSTVLPPLVDYPNHMARLYLLAEGGNAYYAVRWAPLPNLAADLIVPSVARLMPLALAGKMFLVAIFALMAFGVAWLNRVVAGGWRLWPLMAFLFLYNRVFLWGFINYLFGLGVAFCGVALWLTMERGRIWLRILSSAGVALICFFSHVAAFGLYALLIAGVELGPGFAELRACRWRALFRRLGVAAAQFAIPAVIFLLYWHPIVGDQISYTRFVRKADLLFNVFDNYNRPFDIICFVLVLSLLGVLSWCGRLRVAPRLAGAIALVLIAYLLLPTQLLSGSGADHRLPIAVFLLVVAASSPRLPPRFAAAIAIMAVLMFITRTAVIERVWLDADRIYAADLAAIDQLPRGAKLAVAYPAGAIQVGSIPELHVSTLAAPRRDAFVPTVFASPAQQPLEVRAPYAALTASVPPPLLWSAFIQDDTATRLQLLPALEQYDYVIFTDQRPFRVPVDSCLRPFSGQPSFQIVAIVHGEACAAP
jgi:hypothetical protein